MTTIHRAFEVAEGWAFRLVDDTARDGSRLSEPSRQQMPAAFAPARSSLVPRSQLLWAAAALLLEAIADEAPGDPEAAALAPGRGAGSSEPDRLQFPSPIRMALGLLERHARQGPAGAALAIEMTDLPGEANTPTPPHRELAWAGKPLTRSETRVLQYLPSHLAVPEIAAELCLSANTVRTHMQHLYRKLGAHNRHEAVQRARAIGLLATPLGKR